MWQRSILSLLSASFCNQENRAVEVVPNGCLGQCNVYNSHGEISAMTVFMLQRWVDIGDAADNGLGVAQPQAAQDSAPDLDENEHPRLLPNGKLFDPRAVPQLHEVGCEDVHDWTNGNATCSRHQSLIGSAEGRLRKYAFCKATGYTCAAYAVFGLCGTARWPIGADFNHPEHSCCACGGGITAEQLSADCGEATAECQRSIKSAMKLGDKDHSERHVGLSSKSSMEVVQLDLSRLPDAVCEAPCALTPTCHTTVKGEECYRHVVWAQDFGIFRHPQWFDGLSPTSRFDEFQEQLAKTNGTASSCSMPCVSGVERGLAKATSACPWRGYSGPRYGPAFCFSQLAGNNLMYACSCRQGCNLNHVLLGASRTTVTFKNFEHAHTSNGACSSTLLLTCPRDYVKYIVDVKRLCGREGAIRKIEGMLWDAFVTFNKKVCNSVVWQCFHSPQVATVPYLHLHTFSQNAFFHGMPTSNHAVAFCVRQRHGYESRNLAVKLVNML
eukprot:TRINITY_DN14846_c0_g3_i1.p1 TRINITY_DN14846_c0_g3~~TRINITY_DN14846_c0_g3_i1.p1  ORF type:complete len:498 (+),score=52.28 TRINITY_DN14846_c0_g3_i1:88-1581(+)